MKHYEKPGLGKRRPRPSENLHGVLDEMNWLEHLEEEIEPRCQAEAMDDLDLLLKNSSADRATYESLLRVRTLIKKSDDVALPESGHYYDNLHAKIMASIDDEISNGKIASNPSQRARFAWPVFAKPQVVFGALGVSMMLAVALVIGVQQKSSFSPSIQTSAVAAPETARAQQVEERFERKLAAVSSNAGAAFARDMGGYESDEDFLTEAAASRLKQVSKREADAIIRALM